MFTIYIHMLITPVTTYMWWIKKLIRLISVEYSICNPQRKVNSHSFVTWLPLARYLKKEFRKFTNIILWLYHWVVVFFFSCSGPYLTKISTLKKIVKLLITFFDNNPYTSFVYNKNTNMFGGNMGISQSGNGNILKLQSICFLTEYLQNWSKHCIHIKKNKSENLEVHDLFFSAHQRCQWKIALAKLHIQGKIISSVLQ